MYCKEQKIYQYLRQGKRRRTKWHSRKTKSEKIKNKISIEQRPKDIDNRESFGHWEGDSIVSKGMKSFLNTLVERNTRYLVAGNMEMKEKLNTQVYFCHPYSSYERGTNENTNGLLRKYLPKHKRFDDLSQEELNNIVWEINNRPRKCLDYKTATEALEYARTLSVAINPRM